ncbi:MAG: MFS transporter [Chloroflexi bacterium]|nr:MFS transporter [Chloroflexota bacterium]
MEQVVQAQAPLRQNRGFILGSLSFGHGISHLYDQGFPIFMPAIAASMSLNTVQVATLLSIRQVGSGVVNLGGGVLVDMLKRQWGLILTGCMLGSALAYASVGASPSFAFLVLAVILISIPGSLWHLPATAALSQRFPDRRGFAVAMHGFGSSIGNVLGPLMAGGMLTYMLWRNALFLYTIPALLLAGFVWWSLKDVGREGVQEQQTALGSRFRHGLSLLKNPVVMALILTATLRGIGLNALFHWTPFYLEDPVTGLGMSHFSAGYHFALLTGMGIVSAPFIGAASDRFGRKMVLVPGLICASLLSFVVVSVGDSLLLIPVFAGLGLFTFALHQIIQAAVLDVVGRGTEATAIGLIFGLNGIIGGASPFIATLIIDHFGGFGSIFYYAGVLTAVSALIVVLIPLRQRQDVNPA